MKERPQAHAGPRCFAEAIFTARGELRGPLDRAGLQQLQPQLGYDVDDGDVDATEVNMDWGTAKEGYVVAASIRALKSTLREKQLMVQETGFTPGLNAQRCGSFQTLHGQYSVSLNRTHFILLISLRHHTCCVYTGRSMYKCVMAARTLMSCHCLALRQMHCW